MIGKVNTDLMNLLILLHSYINRTRPCLKLFWSGDMIQKKKIKKESRILVIHTGGLQGLQGINRFTIIFSFFCFNCSFCSKFKQSRIIYSEV